MTAQQLKNSILQMAVQGKLVPQDPADEPASVLLERIRAEKEQMVKDGKIKKDKNPSIIFRGEDNLPYEKIGAGEPICIADEIPFEIPDSWEWARLGSLLSIVSDGTHKTPNYVEKGVPFLSVQNISSGKLDLSKIKYIDKEEHQKLIERVCPQRDDILFCRIGTLGKAIRVTWDFSFSIFVSLGLLRPVSSELADFIVFVINSPVGNIWIQDNKVGGGTHTFKVNLVDIPKMLIPVPPFSEQQKILKKVEKYTILINQFCDAEKKLYLLENDFPSQLKKSILQQAVQGKLVPQDPADEPASVLLEEIRAEKEQMIKDGKIKRDKHESDVYRRDDFYYEKVDGVERCIDDEIPFKIPESWEWARLRSVAIINPRNNIVDDCDAAFMPMTLLMEGYRNAFSYETKKWHEIKSGFTHFSEGDIVIAKITPCFQNRKSAIVSELPNGIGAGTTELHVVRNINNTLDSKYLLWLFKTSYFIDNGVKAFTGTAGQQRVGKEYMANFLVPVPPRNEQHRIVKTITALLSIIENSGVY